MILNLWLQAGKKQFQWLTIGIAGMILLGNPAPELCAYEKFKKIVRYDRHFSKYSKRFFGPGFDWHHFKAQAIAESELKPDAKSKSGATGIMQIMPKTFAEITRKNPGIRNRRSDPRWNIAAGIYYDRMLWKFWKEKRPYRDRLDFMFGSYNAGKGNILKAQKAAKKKGLNPNRWGSVKVVLPEITGKRSRETIGYVQKVRIIKEVLK